MGAGFLYVAIAATSLSIGFLVGTARNQPQTRSSISTKTTQNSDASRDEDRENADDASDSESESETGDISSLRVDLTDECKLVLVVRGDLGMSAGKIAAQCSHATLACYKTLQSSNPAMLRQWERAGMTKVALRCSDETELLTLQAQAISLNLCARSIQDAGRTQIAAGSRTVLGIAGPSRLINQVTGALRLL
ncbi:PTH2-domain-containing protein [Mycena floridula]|nr:PTH2-domain-containing protein [Mycena floridula]